MPGGNLWTPEEVRVLAEAIMRGFSMRERIEFFRSKIPNTDRSDASIAKASSDNQKVRELVSEMRQRGVMAVDSQYGAPDAGKLDGPPLISTKHRPVPTEDLWQRAEKRTAAAVEVAKDRNKAIIAFATQKPIALSFISDQHISESAPVYLSRMREDAEIIRDTPGLYAVLGGDGIDNHIKHRAAIVNSASVPGNEYKLYAHYLKMFGYKLVAAVSGNHDDWTHDIAGVDVVAMLAERERIFYAPDYLQLAVVLQSPDGEHSQQYQVRIRHQYRYNSSLNNTHSMKRMWEMDEHDFDIGVLCHLHDAAMEPFRKHGEWRWAFRPGSYQMTSGHSRRYGYNFSHPTCPTVILHPTKREMIGFIDVRQAASYLRYLNSNWPDTDWS